MPGLVSVVIPAYNSRALIGTALESVFAQTYHPVEVIVVDDGSTDGTDEWVRSQYPSIKVVRIANQGPSGARNQGIQLATGDYVAFLDADDVWHPGKLEAQIGVMERYADVGLVASDWTRAGQFGKVPDPVPVSWITYADMLKLNRFQTSTVLMRKLVLDGLEGFDRRVDGAEDWDLWLRASINTRIGKIDYPLVMYRDVPTGYSKDVWRVYETMQPMLDKHRKSAPLSPHAFKVIEAWHHLRFSVAFFLMHDRGHARASLRNISQQRLWMASAPATFRYLLPFLWARYRRRV